MEAGHHTVMVFFPIWCLMKTVILNCNGSWKYTVIRRVGSSGICVFRWDLGSTRMPNCLVKCCWWNHYELNWNMLSYLPCGIGMVVDVVYHFRRQRLQIRDLESQSSSEHTQNKNAEQHSELQWKTTFTIKNHPTYYPHKHNFKLYPYISFIIIIITTNWDNLLSTQ